MLHAPVTYSLPAMVTPLSAILGAGRAAARAQLAAPGARVSVEER